MIIKEGPEGFPVGHQLILMLFLSYLLMLKNKDYSKFFFSKNLSGVEAQLDVPKYLSQLECSIQFLHWGEGQILLENWPVEDGQFHLERDTQWNSQ